MVPFGTEEHVALVEGVDVQFYDREGEVACKVFWLLLGEIRQVEGEAHRLVLREHCETSALAGDGRVDNSQLIKIGQRKQNLNLRLPNLLKIKHCRPPLAPHHATQLLNLPPSGNGKFTHSRFVNLCACPLSQYASLMHGSTSTCVLLLRPSVGRLSLLKLGFVMRRMV